LFGGIMKRTTLALTLTFSLLFSAMAGTSLLNVTGANKACSAPIAHFYQSAVGSAISDNDAEASSPELSPEELWNFTVANYTANTRSFGWRRPNVENGIAYLCNTESYIIPGEPHVPLLDIPVTHSLGTVHAINITSGEELWNLTGAGDHFYFATVDGVAYISASDSRVTNGQSAGGRLYALDAANGTLKWSHHFNGVIHWFPINEGLVYVFFEASDANGHHSYVCALNTSDGSQFWRWEADYSYLSYPAVGDGAIYFGTYPEKQYCAVSALNGTELWRVPVEHRVISPSSVIDGVVYFNSNKAIYALNAENGEKLWNYSAISDHPCVVY
jgi:outer membrane protein assembly factor BamB